jgi:F0F1-type ATP synthase assembly protein I
MKSGLSVSDFAGYGISIGSIVGAVIGVILDKPGTGLIFGMISGIALGFIIGRTVLMRVTIKQRRTNPQ